MNDGAASPPFLLTKEHRRFVEFCDACGRYRYIGLCYGPSGVGKTMSSRLYAQWDRIEQLNALWLQDLPTDSTILTCRTVFYTAPVTTTPHRIAREVRDLWHQFNCLLEQMALVVQQQEDFPIPLDPPDSVKLLIVDEADRLNAAGLEQLRDIYDRSAVGLVLVGMPGIEKRLSRYPQLYSRVGFVHHFRPLGQEEMNFVLQHKWQNLGLSIDQSDFTDAEAVAAIIRVSGGNFRLIQRLFSQIERVMRINELQFITKEIVESARELLVIGSV